MRHFSSSFATGALTIAVFLSASPAGAVPVDLSDWQVDGGGNWILQSDPEPNDSVLQTLNSAPTVFFNNVDSQGTALSGSIEVQTTSDDDFFGFVLGYNDGDLFGLNSVTDYIMVDWKQGTQAGWEAGMSISRVTGSINTCGTCTGTDPWDHDGNVEFLERAATLGSTGWSDHTSYLFDVVFTSTLIEVFVDDVQQFSISGAFSNGSFGFYNFSQERVRYAGITEEVVPDVLENPVSVPEPSTLALLGLVLLGLGLRRKR
ncbi:MAG TPA: PEP-CTERM sorting domain-containing protein [Woeseiaceae bacterium]|nr:PEP-CTERM sorting domain-containing protein [Woeseiaceae bacterium]